MRQILIFIGISIMCVGCQWLLTHPEEDIEIAHYVEEGVEDIYEYETKTLSPSPQESVHLGSQGSK